MGGTFAGVLADFAEDTGVVALRADVGQTGGGAGRAGEATEAGGGAARGVEATEAARATNHLQPGIDPLQKVRVAAGETEQLIVRLLTGFGAGEQRFDLRAQRGGASSSRSRKTR